MLNNNIKRILTILVLFTSMNSLFAQKQAAILKDTIDNQLEVLSSYIYSDTIDPDSLSAVVTHNLVTYINEIGFDAFREQNSLMINSVDVTGASSFSVITIGYNSGGSAGFIPRSIIIKQDGDTFRCYDMSDYEASFYEFHQLKDNIYLCFATKPGWGACMNTGIYAFDFDNISKLDYLSICNADISFDTETKILTFNIEIDDGTSFDEKDFEEYYKIETDEENNSLTISCKFDGTKFVKP